MRHLLATLALLPFACSLLFADEVVLKNGDRISGEVLRLDDDNLIVKTQAMGEVRIKWTAVAKVESEAPLHVTADSAQVMAHSLVRTTEADTVVGPTTAFSMEPGHIRALISENQLPPAEPPMAPWAGTVDLGLTGARGNSDSTNFNLSLKGARTTAGTRLSLSFNSLLARGRSSDGTGVTSAKSLHSGARYEVNVSEHLFLFGFGTFESNGRQNLDLRDVLGGGAGVRAAQSKRGALDFFTGASMNHEAFAPAAATANRLSAELLVGGQSSYSINNRTSLASRFSVYPNLTEAGDYRTVLDTSASTKLNSWIGWQVTLSEICVSNPPNGSRPNDLMLSTGLRFIVGRERPFKSRSADLKLEK
jgi:putative salt-induced outer membrane protein YdiY